MTTTFEIHVDDFSLAIDGASQTGLTIKELAKVPRNCVLVYQSQSGELEIDDDQEIHVEPGYRFCSREPKVGIRVTACGSAKKPRALCGLALL